MSDQESFISHLVELRTRLVRAVGAVRGFKDGMREGSTDKASDAAPHSAQVTGKTVEGEVKGRTEHKV